MRVCVSTALYYIHAKWADWQKQWAEAAPSVPIPSNYNQERRKVAELKAEPPSVFSQM